MRRIVYLLGIVGMWAGWALAFYLLLRWEFFAVARLIFIALAITFGFFTITLLLYS